MKNLLFGLLLLLVVPLQGQNHSPQVLLNCDSTLSITADVPKTTTGGYPAAVNIQVAEASTGLYTDYRIATPAQGTPILFTTVTSINPSLSQYSVTISPIQSVTNPIGNGYPYNSTSIVWFINAVSVPAKLGYTYQYGLPAVQSASCPTQSAAQFVTAKKKKGKGNN